MKTTTDLFIAFTSKRNPTIVNGDDVNFANAKFYFISPKQASWLSSLIFQKASKTKGNCLHATKQYFEYIDGYCYTLIQGKTNRIRVSK